MLKLSRIIHVAPRSVVLTLLVIDLAVGYIETFGWWVWIVTVPGLFYLCLKYLEKISKKPEFDGHDIRVFEFRFILGLIFAMPTPILGVIYVALIFIYEKNSK